MHTDVGGVDIGPDADITDADMSVRSSDWFEVWRQMRAELRADPGYLRYERDRLVAAGDPAAMHTFVRSFRTLPTGWDSWGAPNTLLYGTRGMLRYNAGSMRDKAELLREMLVEAGFEAEVRQLLGPPADFTDRVLRPHEVADVVEPEDVDRWTEELGLEFGDLAPFVDPDGDRAAALADDLVATLPSDSGAVLTFDRTAPAQIPIIRFRAGPDDEWTFANLFLDDVPLGELPFPNTPASAFDANEVDPVAVELRLHTLNGPREGTLLVRGEFPATELAGRQLRVGAMPNGELRDNFLRPIASFSNFVPMIALQGIDADDETRADYSFVGDVFTLRGDRLTVDADAGTLTLNDVQLNADTDADVSLIDAVTGEADARNFPEVLLRVDVTADGAPVAELPATAFTVTDRDEPVAPLIMRNVDRPRVMVIIDESTSLPAEFRTDQLAPLVVDIANTVMAESPLAEFRIFKVGASLRDNEWTQDTEAMRQSILVNELSSSNIWTALGNAAGGGATACVMITDGEATDELTPTIEAQLEASPPCVFLRAGGDPTVMDLETMANIVGGEVFDIADQTEARMQILDYIDQDDAPYLLRYLSVDREPGEHAVAVEVGRATGATSYVAPGDSSGRSFITGVELVISSTPVRPTVQRMLFGSRDGEPLEFDDAQRALLAGHLIAFEGEAPVVHEVIDETLENRLQLEPLTRAIQDDDEDAVLDALERGARWMPAVLLTVVGPARTSDGSVVYTDNLRAAMVSERLVSDRESVSAIDLLNGPGLGVRSSSSDPVAALRQTVEVSVRSSLVEDTLYDTATVSLLDGESLVLLDRAANLGTVIPGLSDGATTAWQRALAPYDGDHFLVLPADGDPIAFYAINQGSGATYAVLADGSGGGLTREQLEDQLAAINSLLDWLSFGGTAMKASPAFGFWIALQKAIAKQIITATIAIVEMTSPTNPSVLADALNLACDLLRGLYYDILGAEWISLLEAYIAAATGDAPITCFDD